LNSDFYRRVPPFFSDAHAALRLHPSSFSKQKSNGPIPPGDDADGTEQALKCSDVKTGCASWHFFDGTERFCSAISTSRSCCTERFYSGRSAEVQRTFRSISAMNCYVLDMPTKTTLHGQGQKMLARVCYHTGQRYRSLLIVVNGLSDLLLFHGGIWQTLEGATCT